MRERMKGKKEIRHLIQGFQRLKKSWKLTILGIKTFLFWCKTHNLQWKPHFSKLIKFPEILISESPVLS